MGSFCATGASTNAAGTPRAAATKPDPIQGSASHPWVMPGAADQGLQDLGVQAALQPFFTEPPEPPGALSLLLGLSCSCLFDPLAHKVAVVLQPSLGFLRGIPVRAVVRNLSQCLDLVLQPALNILCELRSEEEEAEGTKAKIHIRGAIESLRAAVTSGAAYQAVLGDKGKESLAKAVTTGLQVGAVGGPYVRGKGRSLGPKALARSKRPHQQAHRESSHRQRGNQRPPWLGIRAFAQAQHPTILDNRGVLQQLLINEPGHLFSLKLIPLVVTLQMRHGVRGLQSRGHPKHPYHYA